MDLPRANLFALLALFLWGMCVSHAAEAPLEHIADIRALSRAQAEQKLPVHIRGTVTLLYEGHGVFVHDGEQNIWVDCTSLPASVVEGSIVEIYGVTNQFSYSPRIVNKSLKFIGPGELPPARRVPMERLLSAAEDSQRIELEGVVQEALPASKGYLPMFVMAVEGQSCRIKIFGDIDPTKLVDAKVRVRGICFPQVNLRSEAVGIELLATAREIEVLSPPPTDPFNAPRVSLETLMAFSPEGNSTHRKVVTGLVTFIYPGSFFYIREGETSVRIDAAADGIAVGDIVEVAGFTSQAHTLASLRGALVRKTGHAPPPQITDTPPQQILNPVLRDPWAGSARSDQSGMVVRLRGRLLSTPSTLDPASKAFLIESGGQVFPAYLPAAAVTGDPWVPGTDLELTGACELEFKPTAVPRDSITHPIQGFHLWLSSPEAVHVLATPSWWTPQRLSLALGSALLVLLGLLAWSAWLRREVNRRSSQLAEEIAARHETQIEFQTTMRERARLANDLHDNLEQTLIGLSLQLQAADLFRDAEPVRSQQHLHLAEQFLERSREDLHRTVWDLRVLGMEGRSLAECLREKTTAMASTGNVAIDVAVSGNVQPMPDYIAGNLLMLAQEAITNALKHAKAKQITVQIDYRADGVELSIEDDGRGFIPTHVPDHREGHFGLQGMRERMKRLGGALTIHSTPGEGTRIEAFVPAAAFSATAASM